MIRYTLRREVPYSFSFSFSLSAYTASFESSEYGMRNRFELSQFLEVVEYEFSSFALGCNFIGRRENQRVVIPTMREFSNANCEKFMLEKSPKSHRHCTANNRDRRSIIDDFFFRKPPISSSVVKKPKDSYAL